MTYALIGFIVGTIMGMTGAGGAFVAIPLFQIFLKASLKDATVLSLIAVLIGTGVNLIGRTQVVKWKMVFGFAVFGTFANYVGLPLKKLVPDLVIVSLLLSFGLFSIYSVWHSILANKDAFVQINVFKVIGIGLLLGLVTTLTGLGGGVLLIPLLLKIFGMTYEEALPTSLAIILLITLSALIFQGPKTLDLISPMEILSIGAGSILAFAGLQKMLSSLSAAKVLKLRKIVFTISTIASLLIVVAKTFL